MKDWKEAKLEELTVNMTENGGMPSMNFDQQWFDENGALHVNFVSQLLAMFSYGCFIVDFYCKHPFFCRCGTIFFKFIF